MVASSVSSNNIAIRVRRPFTIAQIFKCEDGSLFLGECRSIVKVMHDGV